MVTQTIQFEAVSLREIGSGSITAELFQGSTSKGSLASITEDATRNGRYTGTVADKPAGAYDLQIKYSGYTVSEADLSVDLLLVAGTYVAARLAGLSEVQADTLDSIAIALAGSAPVEPTGTTETVMARLTRIESAVLLANTTIATLESQTSFTLTAGSADNDAYTGQTAVITDQATSIQKAVVPIADYVGSTKTITLKSAPVFTVEVGDAVFIIAGSSGGSQATTLTLGATIPLTLGQVTGLTQDLVVGNSYTEELGTRIPVTLTDSNGEPVATDFGNRSLSDPTCTIKCVLHPINARNTDNVTAAAQGVCEFVPASGSDPASLWIELPKTQTDKLSPGVYSIQFHAIWDDGETVTIAWKGQCRFVRIIRPKN